MSIEAGIGIELDLSGKLENMHHDIKGLYGVNNRTKPQQYRKTWGSQQVGATSPSLIIADQQPAGPVTGRIWNIRALFISGVVDAHTVVTSTGVEFFAGATPNLSVTTQPETANFTDFVGTATQIPSGLITYPRHAIWIEHGERPYALVYGVTAGTQLFILCYYEDWLKQDAEAMAIVPNPLGSL